VCCLFHFLLHSPFFKRIEWDFLVGFIVFKVFFKKKQSFLVGSNYINPEDIYGRLIESLSQISKHSCFNVLDLADFMMHH